MAAKPEFLKHVENVEKALMDQGRIVEAGWMGLRLLTLPEHVSPVQLEAMRNAFFAGAQHLYGSIMVGLEEGDDATANDMRRMENIQKELDEFLVEFKKRHGIR